jgi:hypothetical protein
MRVAVGVCNTISRRLAIAAICDIDVNRSAQEMIREHGNRAAHEAILRAEAMMKVGDATGVATWMPIVEAVRALQRRMPPATANKH